MIRTMVGAAMAVAVLAGPAMAQGTPKAGGTLVYALNADIRSLEPGINRDGNTDSVVQLIYEGLVGYKEDLGVGPALADSWTVSEDGLAYRFTLRAGARFHNGAPVTAEDVKWSFERQMSQAGWGCKRFFDGTAATRVVAVEAPDPRTVVYRLDQPSSLFLKQLANFQCAAVPYHRDSVDGEGKWKAPIGAGPLQVKEWKRGEYITLERFAGYVPSKAPASGFSGARVMHVDQVQFRVIPDESAAEAALVSGTVDVLMDVELHKQASLKQRGMTVLTAPGLSWTALLIQTKDPLLSNAKLRRAIAHAIDVKQIAQVRGAGTFQPNPSVVSSASPFFDERFLAWPAYDPKTAAALLKEAGYKGEPIKIQANKRYVSMFENAVMTQAMLAAVGIKADIEVLDWATQLDNYLKGNFQMQSFGYSARFDPGLLYSGVIGDKGKFGWAQFDDPQARELLAESGRTTDEAKRKEIFLELHGMLAAQVPILGLYYDSTINVVGPKVRGYKAWSANKPLPWGAWKEG